MRHREHKRLPKRNGGTGRSQELPKTTVNDSRSPQGCRTHTVHTLTLSLTHLQLFIPERGSVRQIAWQRAEKTPSKPGVRRVQDASGRCPAGSAPEAWLGSCLWTPPRWGGTPRPGFQTGGGGGTVPRDTCSRRHIQAKEEVLGTQTLGKTCVGK